VVVGSKSEPLPEDTEERMLDFTDLVATAIANADSHAKLEASRARVIAASDATRRLIERDLHSGTQQRLVSLMLELRAAEATPPADPDEVRGLLSHMTQVLDGATEDLRRIARGMHPALLSRRGLEPRSRRSHAAPPSQSISTFAPTGIWRSVSKRPLTTSCRRH
jgi:signal transduction histidine kinase